MSETPPIEIVVRQHTMAPPVQNTGPNIICPFPFRRLLHLFRIVMNMKWPLVLWVPIPFRGRMSFSIESRADVYPAAYDAVAIMRKKGAVGVYIEQGGI